MSAQEIAAKLTKAQRVAVLGIKTSWGRSFYPGAPSTIAALRRLGLVDEPYSDKPNALGLAVRQIIQGETND